MKTKTPISVVVPLYNKRDFILKTLCSALAQSRRALEILVVDDGSTDGGAELIEAAGLEGVRVIRQSNAGVSVARNRGAAEAKGDYIALLDADDWWEPTYLEKMAALIERFPGCGIYSSGFFIHRPEGVFESRTGIAEAGVVGNYFREAFRAPVCWTSACVLDRRKAFVELGGFVPGKQRDEDLWLWTQMALRFPVCHTPEHLSNYNLLAGSDTKRNYRPEGQLRSYMDFACAGNDDLNEYLARVQIGISILQSINGYTDYALQAERDTAFTRRYRLGWWKLHILNRLPVAWRKPLYNLYVRASLLVSRKSIME